MVEVHVESAQASDEAIYLVQSAIKSEIARLKLGLEMAKKRLAPFEQKYGVTSEHFMAEMSAEDLEGGDDEYVLWAGEYKLRQRLQDKLNQLQEIKVS